VTPAYLDDCSTCVGGNTGLEACGCDSSHLNLCTSITECTNAGGYWWSDNSCNDTEEPLNCGSTEFTSHSGISYETRNQSFTLSWTDISGANNYIVQIAHDENFTVSPSEHVISSLSWSTSHQGSYTPDNPVYYRVRANCSQSSGVWSQSIGIYNQELTCDSSHLNLCTTSGTCTGAGGYWWSNNTCNATEEPAVSTVTSTGQVWMDRNLGASQVANAYNDSAAYGDLYQWGRRTDGHEKRTSITTSTLSSSDTPGHGNFIESSKAPYDWRSPQNDNLWQGVSGVNNPCPAGFRIPIESEWETERFSWSSNDSIGAYA